MGDSFTHLHVHTEYSMLDGASRVEEVVAAAAADGQPALGITDHGNMYGILPFYKACQASGITPVLGCELYMAHEHRSERITARGRMDDNGGEGEGGHKAWYHLTTLAETNTGYRNLIQLASRAFLEGYYRKPKVDWDLLDQHHEGIIATTGCLGGHVAQELLNPARTQQESFEAALKKAGRLQDIFGRDNLFVELQDHGIPAQHRTNPLLVDIARRLGAPLLATNDSHYTHPHQAGAHDALLCVQTGKLIADEDRFRFTGEGHYLKSADEMRQLFRGLESACDNTLWVAERSAVDIEFGKPKLPEFPLPAEFAPGEGETYDEKCQEYLRHLTFEGAKQRWGDPLPDAVVERLAYELQVIGDMGFPSYFLIVGDLIAHARELGIRVGPGRGSAAGCAVAYCLRITDLDPVRYDLLFERFLNPSRSSMPDIDMDFDSRYRDEMIRYAAERYGRDHVAQIVTFGTIKARQAVQDASRVLGYDFQTGLRISKAMPALIMGRDTPLWACFEPTEKYADGYGRAAELRAMCDADPDVQRVVEVAKDLEGLRRQDGIHAAAVVITKEPLTEHLPIQRKPGPGQDPTEAPVVTQYEMGGVEELGLLKMDFLGLRNLDVITDTLELIRTFRGEVVDIDALPLDDAATFELLSRGDTMGVFQLESAPMRALLRSLAPSSFEDVSAVIALYRPGPMSVNMHYDYADRKNGRKPVDYFHPDAEELLADTYGLMIYQESVMRVSQRFAGYSLAEADNLRKACGKKKRELMVAEREKFVAGCERTGYGAALGTELFDVIERFADYAFNKSHTFGYGLITYQTAYLKANYPVEYLAALLTSVKANLDKAAVYLADCRSHGIRVLAPDVNRSQRDFVPDRLDDGTACIPFGLSAVRNVGAALVDQIIEEREANGPFRDFYDFCDRVPLGVLNRKTVESLVKAGAFDVFGHSRRGLLAVHEEIVDKTIARRREADMGVMTLFGELAGADSYDDRPPVPDLPMDKRNLLAWEKEMLGLYVSDHPLMGVEAALRRRCDATITEVVDEPRDGSICCLGGVVTALQRKYTRKNDLMAVFTLEDLQGSIEVMVFPRTMSEVGHKLADDGVVTVKGRVDAREDIPKLIAMEVEPLELSDARAAAPLHVRVPATQVDDGLAGTLRELLARFPGDSPVVVHLDGRTLRLPSEWSVDVSSSLMAELRVLLGAGAIV
ncbi:MAG: DNA polymerase III subunit alpha [Actinobacteria bacterium]|nr:DNA polymerase III subunit alpha [Actinomycetota bacterium]